MWTFITTSMFRFIPARAGNTAEGEAEPEGRAVHPRSRGEHVTPNPGQLRAIGSSPLARGTRVAMTRENFFIRFIPARAGNTDP